MLGVNDAIPLAQVFQVGEKGGAHGLALGRLGDEFRGGEDVLRPVDSEMGLRQDAAARNGRAHENRGRLRTTHRSPLREVATESTGLLSQRDLKRHLVFPEDVREPLEIPGRGGRDQDARTGRDLRLDFLRALSDPSSETHGRLGGHLPRAVGRSEESGAEPQLVKGYLAPGAGRLRPCIQASVISSRTAACAATGLVQPLPKALRFLHRFLRFVP